MLKFEFLTVSYLLMLTHLLAQEVYFDAANMDIDVLPMNTTEREFGPALIHGELYYSAPGVESDPNNNPFFDLYAIPMNEAQVGGMRGENEKAINTAFHDGPIAYCEKTGELYVTRSNAEPATIKQGLKQNSVVALRLVIYREREGVWVYNNEFPFNNTNYSVGHPAINIMGDSLVFVSNKPGGYGQSDLYLSVRKDGEWQEPINMGAVVNSKKREMSPFWNRDGRLFFASDRRHGKGGLDVYVSAQKNGVFTHPVNIGKPVNTRSDDFGLTIHPNQKIAYLTSNRKKKRKLKDDIYCLKNKHYDLQILPTAIAREEITAKVAAINKEMEARTIQMKKEGLLPFNVSCGVQFKLLEENRIPDLKISYSYRLTSDSVKLGENAFRLCAYRIEESQALTALLQMIKESIDSKLQSYFTPGKYITISITGNADAFASSKDRIYNGEYGDSLHEVCTINDLPQNINLKSDRNITNNELAFLRSYSVGQQLVSQIKELRQSENTFLYEVIPADQLNIKNEWVKVEMVIQNAFGNF